MHCQAGQGGLSGMIVKAYSGETVVREPQTRRNTRRSTTRGRPRNRNTRSRSSS